MSRFPHLNESPKQGNAIPGLPEQLSNKRVQDHVDTFAISDPKNAMCKRRISAGEYVILGYPVHVHDEFLLLQSSNRDEDLCTNH